jgi:hypothetical protein
MLGRLFSELAEVIWNRPGWNDERPSSEWEVSARDLRGYARSTRPRVLRLERSLPDVYTHQKKARQVSGVRLTAFSSGGAIVKMRGPLANK